MNKRTSATNDIEAILDKNPEYKQPVEKKELKLISALSELVLVEKSISKAKQTIVANEEKCNVDEIVTMYEDVERFFKSKVTDINFDGRFSSLIFSEEWRDLYNYVNRQNYWIIDSLSKIDKNFYGFEKELTNQLAGLKKGDEGEDRVAQYLKRFDGKYHIIKNTLLKSRVLHENYSAEIDLCIVTEKGVFVCEVKNIGSSDVSYIIEPEGRWIKVYNRSGNEEIEEKNPIKQTTDHCLEVEAYLREKGLKNIPVIPVVIIANNEVDIDNRSNSYIIRTDAIYDTIRLDKTNGNISAEEQSKIARLLNIKEVKERYFKLKVLNSETAAVKDQILELRKALDEHISWLQQMELVFAEKYKKVQKQKAKNVTSRHKKDVLRSIFVTQPITCILTILFIAIITKTIAIIGIPLSYIIAPIVLFGGLFCGTLLYGAVNYKGQLLVTLIYCILTEIACIKVQHLVIAWMEATDTTTVTFNLINMLLGG